ncbi:hypothetical protein ESFECK385B1_20755 [Escherichia fergusonii]
MAVILTLLPDLTQASVFMVQADNQKVVVIMDVGECAGRIINHRQAVKVPVHDLFQPPVAGAERIGGKAGILSCQRLDQKIILFAAPDPESFVHIKRTVAGRQPAEL